MGQVLPRYRLDSCRLKWVTGWVGDEKLPDEGHWPRPKPTSLPSQSSLT